MIPEEVFISEADRYLFGQGTHYQIYKKLGAHPSVVKVQTEQKPVKKGRLAEGKKKGIFFSVWAPNAEKVFLIGSFNGWNETANPMDEIDDSGFYQAFLTEASVGDLYKFLIYTKNGKKLYKADPFANSAELRPGTASKIADLDHLKWTDGVWMKNRAEKDMNSEPMAIYECHIGSWMKHPHGEDGFYNYREFADRIVSYLKEMRFTHVELMGIAEHPFDGSWGYQVTGYYAPTSRYGTPEDFAYLVNLLHKNQIGVILDWVPAHFPKDAHGLAEFDGTCLFEHPDPRLGEQPDWGTKIFHFGRHEVSNFLIANALFWIKEFHIDGLRVDAVASMLYLDYGKKDGEWVANKYGGHENLEAIEFFKHLNSTIRAGYPGVMMIAEESTAWPKVTAKPEDGGLGFHFKWNMGWMHDFCEYMKLDPYFRRDNHYKMTFAMSYNSSENYILPLSHDEVVHLKCSMLEKMPGYPIDKYANLRIGYAYMFGHEGKKLLFMGQEFGQEREWSEKRELDWFLLERDLNKGMQCFMEDLLTMYHQYPCLYEIDNDWSGFEWINADDKDRSIYSFVRKTKTGKGFLLFVINMTPIERNQYMVGTVSGLVHTLVLNSEDIRYGGNGAVLPQILKPRQQECDRQKYSVTFDLPAFGAAVYAFDC